MTLFDIPEQEQPKPNTTCKDCQHRQRWQCGSKVIQYCGVRRSNRTENKLLKIKAGNTACNLFKHEETT
jgi:hypothetical protein